MDQQTRSAAQFGDNAHYYLASEVHARGEDLVRLAKVAARNRSLRALDLGCGAGHASFALARGGAQRVVAYDPSAQMLAVVAREAAERGHGQIEIQQGAAEVLPFPAATFDLVVTRYSAHHWADVPKALKECARVLVPGGRLIVIDVIAPEQPLLDTALQVIEFLRDSSHVRNYRAAEWGAMQRDAGFHPLGGIAWKISLEFQSWIARIGTPPTRIAALRTVFAEFPREACDYFAVSSENSFVSDAAWFDAELRATAAS